MKKSPFLLLFGLFTACTSGRSTVESTAVSQAEEAVPASGLQAHIDTVQQAYAPDKRTVLFQVKAKGQVLSGETNMPEAKAALVKRLEDHALAYVDSIQVLPAADLAGQLQGVVTLSVANLRTEPKHRAELATQATMGTPVRVWKKEKDWYLVQTPDQYLAWVDASGLALMDAVRYAAWQQGEKLLYTKPYGFAYAGPEMGGATVSDLVYGDVLLLKGQQQGFYQVAFPDGRTAFVPAAEASQYKAWLASRQPTEANLVAAGKQLLGLPYLWGGTSFKGVDCSGFTKTVYFMNGLVLPRDASQQVHMGQLVDTSKGWEQLQPGDLLFFGTPATADKPERVVHVGMWIGGNQEFIHAAGRVRINSMNPEAPNFDAFEQQRFLRAKRIPPQATLQDLREQPLYE